jgi:hypothetical protein
MCGGTRRIFECYQRPVLPENHIIAGHGRVEAAKLLCLDCVPTVRLAHLNAAQRRAPIYTGLTTGLATSPRHSSDLAIDHQLPGGSCEGPA